jgi:sec-independent protein translocase protein TatB
MGSLSIWHWLIVLLIVALVVLGPEPLLRTTRRQCYINGAKAEVTLEIDIGEWRRMKSELESATSDVKNTIHENLRKHQTGYVQ